MIKNFDEYESAESERPIPRPRRSHSNRPSSSTSTYSTYVTPHSASRSAHQRHNNFPSNNRFPTGRGHVLNRASRSSSHLRQSAKVQVPFHHRSSSQSKVAVESIQSRQSARAQPTFHHRSSSQNRVAVESAQSRQSARAQPTFHHRSSSQNRVAVESSKSKQSARAQPTFHHRSSSQNRVAVESAQSRQSARAQPTFHHRSFSQNRVAVDSPQHNRGRRPNTHHPSRGRSQQHGRNFSSQNNDYALDPNHRKQLEEYQSNEFSFKPLSYKVAEEMFLNDELDLGNIALRLTTESSGFVARLKTDMHDGWIQLILKLMGKLCKSEISNRHLTHVLLALLNNDFYFKAFKFLGTLLGKRSLRSVADAAMHISNCLDLMKGWLIYTQNTSEQAIAMLLPYIKSMVIQHTTLDNFENIQEKLVEIESLQCSYQPQQSEQKSSHPGRGCSHEEEPPDDFRTISVFPTIDDIKAKESPFVRTNLIDSAYRDTDHYLDVQFRLLREDFVRPLREGIDDFTNPDLGGVLSGKKRKRYQGLKAYDNVSITFPKLSGKGIYYCIHFDITRLKSIQWQNSKRLLYGNLVCLSSDDFENHFLFASVTDRNLERLQLGNIEVEFLGVATAYRSGGDRNGEDLIGQVGQSSLISLEDMKKTYCMVESEAYFEAYRHVLTGLKETHEIPLSQYIIRCQSNLQPPMYLRRHEQPATYDFSSILDDTENSTKKTCPVLDTAHWPEAINLKLDESQVMALKSALTHELSIIQGPPGTGKTHVGLMIIKMLLGNKKRNDDRNQTKRRQLGKDTLGSVPHGPILIVCFTNHALDQFLEGIAKFHPQGLIRVGGRCKTESLKKYELSSVRRSTDTSLDKASRTILWHLREDLEKIVDKVEWSQKILMESTRSILTLECLQHFIRPDLLEQLEMIVQNRKDDDKLLNWLGVQKKTYTFPEDFYVVRETLKAVLEDLTERRGFTKNYFVAAMNTTGSLNEHVVVRWCYDNKMPQNEVEPNSDVVYAHLDKLRLPFDPRVVISLGFHEMEVKCAWLVCSKQLEKEKFSEDIIVRWLSDKRELGSGDNIVKTDDDNIEDESDYLQDQRIIDMEADDQLQFIRTDEQRRTNKKTKQREKRNFVAAKYQEIAIVVDSPELEAGFELQPHEKKRRRQKLIKQIRMEMNRVDTMSEDEVEAVKDVFRLTRKEKWKLYRYWVNTLRTKLRDNHHKHASEYNRLAQELAQIRRKEDMMVLQTADVIAMTTTGAAKYRDMIYKLPVKVMIVEEAAEVLEAHIVTSMPQTTQHLILIGDHQQLKPSPTVYELARKYNLDTSLFERLVKNGIPCSKLKLQHRMRPRIADLVRPHIYKDLKDHDSVLDYENVVGVQRNVFFLSHTYEEKNVSDTMSKTNQYEADFIVSLCRYLFYQGYLPEQITILTAYVGQLFAFKKVLARKLNNKKVRVTAVDNFQGEENDIILLSLVRSNDEGKIGFLSIENRVCVALSRAKKGLFCIGNFEMLKEKSNLWRKILKGLEEDDLLGEALPLQCKNHPDKITKVKTEKDFEQAPEGGCGQPCRYRLDCGHVCTRLCHPDDENHETFVCRKPCEKLCDAGHKVLTPCSEEPRCMVKIDKIIPSCGHLQEIYCHQDPNSIICKSPCKRKLNCGHSCTNLCGVACVRYCSIKVKVERQCGHIDKVSCFQSKDVAIKYCKEKCNDVLKCGHVCRGSCGQCKQGRLHVGCSNPRCGRHLCCGHICKERCCAVCPPCLEKCETSCQHSTCKKSCFVPCNFCTEKCEWKCSHYECSKLCSEPCDRPRCNESCPKQLKCKHPCIGLCGEPCPTLCWVCDKKKIAELGFGNGDEDNARFVQLECGHIFTYENLDIWMEMENTNEGSETDIKLKECPRCKTPIRRSTRYGQIVNYQLMLINKVKTEIAGDPSEVERLKHKLKDCIEVDADVLKYYPDQYLELKKSATNAKSLPALNVIEVQYDCAAEFSSIKKLTRKRAMKNSKLENDLHQRMSEILQWLFSRKRAHFSDQEKEDLFMERQRCNDALKLIQFAQFAALADNNTVSLADKYTKRIREYVFDDLSPYSETKQEKVKDAFVKIERHVPHLEPVLGITEKERAPIFGELNLRKEKTQLIFPPKNRVATQMDEAIHSERDPFHNSDEVLQWRDGL